MSASGYENVMGNGGIVGLAATIHRFHKSSACAGEHLGLASLLKSLEPLLVLFALN